jgi:dipeptidyl aminopeptidase/acylaminoacyl peptidase
MESFMALMPQVSLVGHLANIKIPFLITHGVNDRQIPPNGGEK